MGRVDKGKWGMNLVNVFLLMSVLVSVVFIGVLGGGCSMNVKQGNFAEYPQQVQVGTVSTQRVYAQKPGYYAVHYAQPEDRAEDMAASEAISIMEEEGIAVFLGTPGDHKIPNSATISPVYALQPNGTLTIPTGRIFVRLAENIPIESRQDQLQAAGYEIVDRPAYAPHTAWVRWRSGNIADALIHLSQLMAIPDMENVEPQMLMQRSFR
jgi:hypothetical protein